MSRLEVTLEHLRLLFAQQWTEWGKNLEILGQNGGHPHHLEVVAHSVEVAKSTTIQPSFNFCSNYFQIVKLSKKALFNVNKSTKYQIRRYYHNRTHCFKDLHILS